jgi:integrase
VKEFQTAHPVVDPEEWPEAVDLIFVTEFGRPVNVNSLVYKHFKPLLKRAGLPNIRLYDLRHTAATLALTVGVSPKVVSEQLDTQVQRSPWMCTRTYYRTCKTMLPQRWKPR